MTPAHATEERPSKWPDAVLTGLLLLPGFITIRVSEYYATGAKLSDVELVASALAFTLVAVVAALVICRGFDWACRRETATGTAALLRPLFLTTVVVVSAVLGYGWAWLDASDRAYVIAPTPRASRQPLWQWLFDTNAKQAEPQFVKIVLEDGTTYFGPPTRYARSEDGQEALFIGPAAMMANSGVELAEGIRPCVIIAGGVFVRKDTLNVVEFHPVSTADKKSKDYCDLLRASGGAPRARLAASRSRPK
jgi:hypothetical protein